MCVYVYLRQMCLPVCVCVCMYVHMDADVCCNMYVECRSSLSALLETGSPVHCCVPQASFW